jgi:hypothetical protein
MPPAAKIWAVICFLHAENMSATEIHRELRAVCCQNVRQCVEYSKMGGRKNFHVEERNGHTVRVRGDETWVSFVNADTKEQSKQ